MENRARTIGEGDYGAKEKARCSRREEGDRDAPGKEGGHEMARREGETERNERRKDEGRKEDKQAGR